MYLKGTDIPIPEFMAQKLLHFIENKITVEPLVNFWKHLILNPDAAVRQQLYGFLEHNGHPITDMGYFMAYKSINVADKYDTETGELIQTHSYDENTGERIAQKLTQKLTFRPMHSGDYGMVVKVGEPVTMPREKCDPDPNQTCSIKLF
jgi:hypothetical protein